LWSLTGLVDAPPVIGAFRALAYAIAGTAVLKAFAFGVYLVWRRGFAERVDIFGE
jgi:hypothetical protein